MSSPSIFPLVAFSQSYDWGKLGSTSKVAQYAAGNEALTGFKVDERKPYAELWMGTHPTLPSKLEDGTTLSQHIEKHPEVLGGRNMKDLPFLFKVLAIRKALSIQSHPDKKMAERLHREQPQVYKDPNHKPEMAIALTPFRALCGFRPISQISLLLSVVPELCSLVPHATVHSFLSSTPVAPISRSTSTASIPTVKSPLTQPESYPPEIIALLKSLFASLMTAPPASVKAALTALMDRYGSSVGPSKVEKDAGLVELAITLNEQFPGDVGVFCIYLLNVVDLEPGEAIFLGAGEPHAYVSGDIMECMATSDNVLRAGLTPKARDVPNLLASLTYKPAPAAQHMVYPRPFAGGSHPTKTQLYDPPVPEFSVLRVALSRDGEEESHAALGGPSILIVSDGSGKIVAPRVQDDDLEMEIKEGSVMFAGAGVPLKFVSGQSLVVYRAFYEE